MDYYKMGLELTKKLVSYDSVLKEYKENDLMPFGKGNYDVLNFFLNYAKGDGFTVKNIDNYVGYVEYGSGDEILGILAHLDVVPYKKEEWDSNPLELIIKEDRMIARGAIDDKGPLAASYMALKKIKDEGFIPNKRIRLIVGCDEESGSRCLERYIEKEGNIDLGFSPDANFPLIYGEKGIGSFDITSNNKDNVISYFDSGDRYNIVPSKAIFKLNVDLKNEFLSYLKENNYSGNIDGEIYEIQGKAAHGSLPQEGINAITLATEFISKYTDSKLAKYLHLYTSFDPFGEKFKFNMEDKYMGKTTSNLAILKLDDNGFKLGFNVRVCNNDNYELIEKSIKEINKEYNYNFNWLHKSDVHFVSPESKLVKTLMNSYQKVTNDYKNGPITIGGGTYAREFKNAVAFGPVMPGSPDTCHIANEYMMLKDFKDSIEIYYDSIKELAK